MTESPLSARFRTPGFLVPLCLLLMGIVGTWWFLQNYEREAYEEYQQWGLAARKNPLLAAERYLRALGKKVASCKGMTFFSDLPPIGDAILLLRMPTNMGKNLTDNLYSWVKEGGHLFLVPVRGDDNQPDADDIVRRVGAQLNKKSCNEGKPTQTDGKTGPEAREVSRADEEDEGCHSDTSVLKLNVDGFPVRLERFKAPLLADMTQSATFRIDGSSPMGCGEQDDRRKRKRMNDDGAWLLQYEVGAGTITVMSEMALFTNLSIGKYDHAFFLSWLLRDANHVWLLYSSIPDSLAHILWNQFPYFWLSFAALIVLVIWRMQKRSGELLRPQRDSRRNILAHIDATGLYSWRMDKGAAMIAENRETILHRLARRKFGWRQGEKRQETDISALAAKIGVTEQEFSRAFRDKVVSEQDMIRTSRALQRIEILIHNGERACNEK